MSGSLCVRESRHCGAWRAVLRGRLPGAAAFSFSPSRLGHGREEQVVAGLGRGEGQANHGTREYAERAACFWGEEQELHSARRESNRTRMGGCFGGWLWDWSREARQKKCGKKQATAATAAEQLQLQQRSEVPVAHRGETHASRYLGYGWWLAGCPSGAGLVLACALLSALYRWAVG